MVVDELARREGIAVDRLQVWLMDSVWGGMSGRVVFARGGFGAGCCSVCPTLAAPLCPLQENAAVGRGRFAGKKILLVKPMT